MKKALGVFVMLGGLAISAVGLSNPVITAFSGSGTLEWSCPSNPLEALACGLPVVTQDDAVRREVLGAARLQEVFEEVMNRAVPVP
ncbi:MAG TPA: hypothetical protein P5567_14795 [Kiritimatiellia bacterium]|nr:hypothetical protein [Kiritimatiellia bacterium]HRZ13709.1 hypothetical protein [Kiritimatiellia bacterium]HSA19383.1 hypothetical protein [Kiritimatiellia bacterium]